MQTFSEKTPPEKSVKKSESKHLVAGERRGSNGFLMAGERRTSMVSIVGNIAR